MSFIVEHRGYLIKAYKESPSCYAVVTAGKGGKIPDILSGLYTSRDLAKAAIDLYLSTKPNKEVANGNITNQTGSTG